MAFSAIELVNALSGRQLNNFGIIPRHFDALPGILISLWLHSNIEHFLANMLPLLVFAWLLMQQGKKYFLWISLWLWLGTGMLVWLLGRPAVHIGASGLIYGYFGYLLILGFINRKFKLLMISLGTAVFYGGLVWGLIPQSNNVSWESHLFGFLLGLIAARYWSGKSH